MRSEHKMVTWPGWMKNSYQKNLMQDCDVNSEEASSRKTTFYKRQDRSFFLQHMIYS